MGTHLKSYFSLILFFSLFQISADAQRRGYYGRGNYGYRGGGRIFLNRPTYAYAYRGYYHYLDGGFYQPFGGSYFGITAPPFGIHINFLPFGYNRIWAGGYPYYYYNGTFYRHYEDYYEVVTPPVGAEVADLPSGARPLVIDNKKYYEYEGTFYKETIRPDGEIWYTVTGKRGQLNSDPEVSYHSEQVPQPGTEFNILPEGSKTIVVNNQKYFVGPDNTYYQEEIENNQIFYRVVGKPSAKK